MLFKLLLSQISCGWSDVACSTYSFGKTCAKLCCYFGIAEKVKHEQWGGKHLTKRNLQILSGQVKMQSEHCFSHGTSFGSWLTFSALPVE